MSTCSDNIKRQRANSHDEFGLGILDKEDDSLEPNMIITGKARPHQVVFQQRNDLMQDYKKDTIYNNEFSNVGVD